MPDFKRGPDPANYAPFGKNEFRRSTKNEQFEHFTFSKEGIPSEQINGTTQKVLQPGTVIAKITSGPEAGKVGVFQAEATDGRQTAANIVGLVDTFLPWQLLERDVEVAVLVHGRVVQAWCIEYNAAGARIPLTNTTAAEMVSKKTLSILFS